MTARSWHGTPLAVAVIVAWLGIGPAACSSDPSKGYAFSSSHEQGVRTVHVPVFQNTTFSRGVEIELTDAIIKEIQTSTPWRVVSGGSAQTTLTGSIVDSRLRRLSQARQTGLAQEMSATLTLEFDWKDNRTGKVLVSRKNFAASAEFVPARPLGERLEVGQYAVIQQIARDVVNELRSNW